MRRTRRALNPERVNWSAAKQARYMQSFDDEDLRRLKSAMLKKGEIYDINLYPDKALVQQAVADYDGFRTGTSAMEAIGKDMRAFYGLQRQMGDSGITLSPTEIAAKTVAPSPVTAPVLKAAAPTEIKERFPIQTTVPTESAVKVDAPYVTSTVPKQGASSPIAEEVKDSYLNNILGYNVKDVYEQIKNTKGLLTDSALTDAAIAGGGVLGLTGIAGLGGADGGDAVLGALAGGTIAAGPAIFNEVRDPKYRTGRAKGRDLVGLIAASAGAGAGSSMLLDALGLTNQG